MHIPSGQQGTADDLKLPSINIFLEEVEVLENFCHNNLQAKVSVNIARSRIDSELYRLTFVRIHEIKIAQKLISLYRKLTKQHSSLEPLPYLYKNKAPSEQ
jgi:hypothetical protein